MTEQNDKPGTVYLIGVEGNSSARHERETFGHVDVLDNGWVYCRDGTHGSSAAVTYYPAHRVARIDRDTDQ